MESSPPAEDDAVWLTVTGEDGKLRRDLAAAAFDRIDADGDGSISQAEFKYYVHSTNVALDGMYASPTINPKHSCSEPAQGSCNCDPPAPI